MEGFEESKNKQINACEGNIEPENNAEVKIGDEAENAVETEESFQNDASCKICKNCGTIIKAGQKFCVKCGKAVDKKICKNCGAELQDFQTFCAKCGEKVELEKEEKRNKPEVPKTQNRKIVIIIAAVVVLCFVLAISLLGGSSGPNLERIYDEHCLFLWAEVGTDGSYLKIDTNPYDEEDGFLSSAYYAIEAVNAELGLPDYLFADMGETTWSMGKQSEIFEDAGVVVSWTYHPDKGLEVMYKKI